MRLVELAVLYGFVGAGCAAVLLVMRGASAERTVDAVTLLVLWPLYGPFLLMRTAPPDATPGGLTAPTQAFLESASSRLAAAAQKIEEIDELLGKPDFSEDGAMQRHRELTERGDERAAATVMRRVESIQRLRGLQVRYRRELDEVNELLAQLRIQTEVVRLAGNPDGSVADLVRELMSRIEGLDAVLEIETD